MAKYVVVADAAVVTVGKKSNGKPQTARALRGEVINVENPDSETLAALLGTRSVVKAKNAEHLEELKSKAHRLTAKKAAAAAGAVDAVLAPEAAPLDAPLPDTRPQSEKPEPVPAEPVAPEAEVKTDAKVRK